jgi:hypothetical protein
MQDMRCRSQAGHPLSFPKARASSIAAAAAAIAASGAALSVGAFAAPLEPLERKGPPGMKTRSAPRVVALAGGSLLAAILVDAALAVVCPAARSLALGG